MNDIQTYQLTDRQVEIIESAGKILTSSGVGGLTIKNLAKEMGFSESAIYRHFSSKEEIIVEMMKYLQKDMQKRLVPISKSDDSNYNKIIHLFNNQLDYFSNNQHFVVVAFSDGLLEESKDINDSIMQNMRFKSTLLLNLILNGQEKGEFKKEFSAEILTNCILGSFRLQMLKWKLSNFSFDNKKSVALHVSTILNLIKN